MDREFLLATSGGAEKGFTAQHDFLLATVGSSEKGFTAQHLGGGREGIHGTAILYSVLGTVWGMAIQMSTTAHSLDMGRTPHLLGGSGGARAMVDQSVVSEHCDHTTLKSVAPHQEAPAPSRVRLLLLVSSLEFGGAERQVVHLANHLSSDRFDVSVCSLSPFVPLADDLHDRERRLHIVARRSRFDLAVVGRVADLMERLRTQVVHGFLFDAEMIGRLAARSAQVPVVIASERNSNYRIPWLHWCGQHLTLSMFDVMIANSEAGKRFNMRTLGLPASRIKVIRNGVDTDRFRPDGSSTLRTELNLPDDAFVVGMVAKFKRQKNHGVFLRMARKVLERVPNAWFVCVGEPLRDNFEGAEDYHREMREVMTTLGLEQRCLLLGNRADMPDVYRSLNVAVLTSLREGTPNVLLEAMACGVPVVASDVADNRLVVPDKEAGFIVPPNDVDETARRVSELVDGTVRKRMGTVGRRWVEQHFSLDALTRQTQQVYLDALGRSCNAQPTPCGAAS